MRCRTESKSYLVGSNRTTLNQIRTTPPTAQVAYRCMVVDACILVWLLLPSSAAFQSRQRVVACSVILLETLVQLPLAPLLMEMLLCPSLHHHLNWRKGRR